MIIRGTFMVIAGKASVVGRPDSWKEGLDDWELKPGDQLVVTRDDPVTQEQTLQADLHGEW